MSVWPFRSRTFLIIPLVLLVFVLLEEVMTYKVRQHVRDVYTRAAVIMLLNAFAFGFAAGWLGPHLRELLKSARTRSNRAAGTIGLWVFYAAAYGAVYLAFLVVERKGVAALLPTWLR